MCYQNLRGTPSLGALNTRRWGKWAIFDGNCRLSRKQYEIGSWLLWNFNRKSQVVDQSMSMSVPMTLSELERRDMRGQIFFRWISLITLLPFDLERPNLAEQQTWGGAYFWRVSRAPTPRGQSPSAAQFWEFPYTYAYTFCRRTTKFDVVTHIWRGLVLDVRNVPTQSGRGPALSNFCDSLILCVITHMGSGCVVRGLATAALEEDGVPALPNFVSS